MRFTRLLKFELEGSKAGCEQNVMDKELAWCGNNYISMGDCVKWIRENLEYQCSKSQYSCIMSNASSWSTWRSWESTRFVAESCF